MAEIFDKDRTVITKHINNILDDGELNDSVCANFAHTASDAGQQYRLHEKYPTLAQKYPDGIALPTDLHKI